MKVLFICSGNLRQGINPIIRNQGEALKSLGILVDYFTINGKGINSYLRHILILRKHIKNTFYDVYHAHYFFSGLTAWLAFTKPLVISLMGSDIYSSKVWHTLIRIIYFLGNVKFIVKSEKMKKKLNLKKVEVLPNGVILKIFYQMDKFVARKKIKWDSDKYILFGSNPARLEKNYELAIAALICLNKPNVFIKTIINVPNKSVIYYLNAADILLLTSSYEGSPNVIKEAMACNCPIVSTNVGDVSWVLGDIDGCFLTSFEPQDVANKINLALDFSEKYDRTKGRSRIIELGLDSNSVAQKIIGLYKGILEKK